MANDYGAGVSRVLDPTSTQFLGVVWQAGLPPLDSEWNLVGDLAAVSSQQQVLRGMPSGWLGNDTNPSKVYVTDPTWSNFFQFGQQRASDKQSIMWANVNGWLVPVSGTQTGSPPGSPSEETFNRVLLDPPPGSAGDARADFVFLEVWKARIAPYPSTLNKPNGSALYKLGNIEGGFSYLPDDLMDPAIGEETTERIQLQYRIRVVKGLINLGTNPDGFDPTVVKAQGAQATAPSVGGYTFTNMREELGDPGLWRAGDGTQNTLGTVDGYVYAIPILCVFRRNSIPWSGDPAPNLNGGFNRNPSAVDRTGTTTFSTVPTLASDLNDSATTISIISASNIPLPAAPSSAVAIQIGDEVITYNSISGTNISVLLRGANGTVAEAHKAGSIIKVISSRPDGLFSDQVTETDILDLRHVVNTSGFDSQSLLQSNLDKLLRGQLRSTWKKSGTDNRGPYVFFEDKVSQTPPAILGITALDAPDHIRLAFSDAALPQKVEVVCKPVVSGPTFPLAPPTSPFVTPSLTWDLQLPNPVMAIAQKAASVWSSEATTGDGTGDTIQIDVTQFQSSLPGSDADQVRFLNEAPISSVVGYSYGTYQLTDVTVDFVNSLVYPGDVIVIFTPLTGSPLGGTYPITEVTSTVLTSSVVIPAPVTPGPVSYEIRRGVGSVQIRIEGSATALDQNRFKVTPLNPVPTDNLVIQFVGAGAPFPTSSSSAASQLYVTTNIQYGGGRGLARRPDSVHNVTLLNPGTTPEILIQPSHDSSGGYKLNSAWVPLWSKFRNEPYKGLLPVTSGSYIDSGSKSVILQPFQRVEFPGSVRYLTATNIMPARPSGYGPAASDPLGLFSSTNYITLPRHLCPGFGSYYIPILPGNSTDFSRGVNFMLMAREAATDNSEYINYTTLTTTCAIFSTLISYNTASGSPLRAGMRLFNDDPTIGGALPTARGLG